MFMLHIVYLYHYFSGKRCYVFLSCVLISSRCQIYSEVFTYFIQYFYSGIYSFSQSLAVIFDLFRNTVENSRATRMHFNYIFVLMFLCIWQKVILIRIAEDNNNKSEKHILTLSTFYTECK